MSASTGPTADPGSVSDAELLRRHVAGDTDAFGELFRRHRDRLWAVALRTVCDQEEAADALQDAMLSAFRRAGDFRGESAVTTWLHRIVVNACLDRLRRRAARPAMTGEDEALAALAPQTPDGTELTAARLDVDAALRMLPPPQRAALVLVDMLGYSVSDAADILGISPGTVKSRCARSRAKLLPLVQHLRGGLGGRPPVRQHGTSQPASASHRREEMHEGPPGRGRPGGVPRLADHRSPAPRDCRAPVGLH